jgi:probable phosphoglycerate mutase
MTATIHLMRHGSIVGHETRRFVGQSEIRLDDAGRAMAECWRERYGSLRFSAVFSSDLSRCVETAEILTGRKPVTVPELREIHLGEWQGRTVQSVRETEPGAYAARGRDIAGYRPPGGESFEDLAARVRPAFEEIMRGASGDLLVAAHGGVNRVLLCTILGMPLANLFRLGQDYGCMNLIAVKDNGPIVRAVNLNCR